MIRIAEGRIKEIHQSDLKPFPKLEYLDLDDNDIEIIEEGLFAFNPELIMIIFSENKISQIHANVFDHFTKLTYLRLNKNQCIDMTTANEGTSIQEIIQEVKAKC